MAFGEIAKQLAQQALTEPSSPQPSTPTPPGSVAPVMVGQVQAMQKACKEDEELMVLFRSGPETIRVLEIIVPSPAVLVLAGVDEANNTTRVVASAEAAQLVCKVMKVASGGKPVRLGFRIPKPKPQQS
jgi:hypothetical protein